MKNKATIGDIFTSFSVNQIAWMEFSAGIAIFSYWKDKALVDFNLKISTIFSEILVLVEAHAPRFYADDPISDHPQQK
ncbi:hypothetical protein V6N13_140770 [Hibiscus sabdariffa]|uniref:Uncharacterized protein n=1 Tax=Hibiscus sabdariffa TaxID=183260 RepID=A0ABR2Q1X1_9ROSI